MRDSRGFSLVEVLIAVGVFVTVVITFFGVASTAYKVVSKASDKVQAAFLVEEGVEAVKFLRDNSWVNNIEPQSILYDQCLRIDDTLSPPQFTTKASGLDLLMHMDETGSFAAGASIKDSSGKENNGTVIPSGPALTSVGGNVDPALQTALNNGTHPDVSARNIVQIPDTNADADFVLNSFTISVWIKTPYSNTSRRRIISQSGVGISWFLAVRESGGVLVPEIGSSLDFPSGPSFPNSPGLIKPLPTGITTLSDNNWHHLVMVRDMTSGVQKIYTYVDGKLAGTPDNANIGSYNINQPLTVFGQRVASPVSYGDYYFGSIDEVSVYNRPLSQLEIQLLWKYNIPGCGSDLAPFARSVRFQNICRTDIAQQVPVGGNAYVVDDILGPTTSIDGTPGACSFAGAQANSATLDTNTKYAKIRVFWDEKILFNESGEIFFSNLFNEEATP